jgi:hypothetical protein
MLRTAPYGGEVVDAVVSDVEMLGKSLVFDPTEFTLAGEAGIFD